MEADPRSQLVPPPHRARSSSPRRDYVPLANLIGIIFQIRDDYVNLQSAEVRPLARLVVAVGRERD